MVPIAGTRSSITSDRRCIMLIDDAQDEQTYDAERQAKKAQRQDEADNLCKHDTPTELYLIAVGLRQAVSLCS